MGVWDGACEEEEYEGEINVDTLEILLRHCLLHFGFWVYEWSSGWTGHLGPHGVRIRYDMIPQVMIIFGILGLR